MPTARAEALRALWSASAPQPWDVQNELGEIVAELLVEENARIVAQAPALLRLLEHAGNVGELASERDELGLLVLAALMRPFAVARDAAWRARATAALERLTRGRT